MKPTRKASSPPAPPSANLTRTNIVQVIVHVDGKLASLAETLSAALNSASIRLFTRVHEHMLSQVLRKSEALIAHLALVLGHWEVGLHVSLKTKFSLID